MVRVGLIGYGTWGKIIFQKLEKICEVKFTCRSKDTYLDKLDNVDWVVVATPNDTHYKIVKECMRSDKNVFCEKPLTPTYIQSEELYRLAETKDVKLYVDDIQNYRKVNYDIKEHNFIERKKKDTFNSSFIDSKELLYRLAYHDIYYLYEHIKSSEINDVIPLELGEKLHFKVIYDFMDIEFLYDINYKDGREHNINGVSLMGDGTDDPLHDMLEKVFKGDVDFQYNRKISLFTNKYIDKLYNIFDTSLTR